MTVISSSQGRKSIVTIVCCLHGDERFGLDVFSYYRRRLSHFPGLKIILANERAVRRNARYIDYDLNRIFSAPPRNSYEGSLVPLVRREIRSSKFVLDIHTTTSELIMTPIITSLYPEVRRVINLCSSSEIVYMKKIFAKNSLIGQVRAGVSLEFNERYGHSLDALTDVQRIVHGLLSQVPVPPIRRKIFYVQRTIPKTHILPPAAKNFIFLRGLSIYPFLLHERAYQGIQGFAAQRRRIVMI